MCIEDIRMGRRAHTNYKLISIPEDGTVLLMPANPSRIAFRVSHQSSATIQVFPTDLGATNIGLWLGDVVNLISMDIKVDGNVVTKAWYVKSNGFASEIYFQETLLEDR